MRYTKETIYLGSIEIKRSTQASLNGSVWSPATITEEYHTLIYLFLNGNDKERFAMSPHDDVETFVDSMVGLSMAYTNQGQDMSKLVKPIFKDMTQAKVFKAEAENLLDTNSTRGATHKIAEYMKKFPNITKLQAKISQLKVH